MGHRNAPAQHAAEEARARHADLPSGEIVGRDLDRCLGIGVALERAVHPGVKLDDIAGPASHDGRREILRHHQRHGARAFAEIAAELAAQSLSAGASPQPTPPSASVILSMT